MSPIENIIKRGLDDLHEGYTFLVSLDCYPANNLLETYLAHSVVDVLIGDIDL
jgi:hypothetical protein